MTDSSFLFLSLSHLSSSLFPLSVMPFHHSIWLMGKSIFMVMEKFIRRIDGIIYWTEWMEYFNESISINEILNVNWHTINICLTEKIYSYNRKNLCCKRKYSTKNFWKFFFQWCETRKECERLRLTDLLAKPMQRLTKYPLLLKAILRKSDDETEISVLKRMVSRLLLYFLSLSPLFLSFSFLFFASPIILHSFIQFYFNAY